MIPPEANLLSDTTIATALNLTKGSDRNRARLFLAALAIRNLGTTMVHEDYLPRTRVFAGTNTDLIKWPSVQKEFVSKKWQVAFLSMLKNANILSEHSTKSGGVGYSYGSKEILNRAVEDLLDGNFEFLKMLLWPADYDAPTAKDFKEAEKSVTKLADGSPILTDADQTEADDQSDEPANDEPVGLEVIEKVAANLKDVATHLGELYKQASAQRDDIKFLSERLLEVATTFMSFDDKISAMATRINGVVEKLEKVTDDRGQEEREALRDLVTKMIESDARKRSLANQLESESRRLDSMAKMVEEKLGKR